MQTILAKDILKLDTISRGNNRPWDKIINYLESNNITEDIEFDFKGIEVFQPCSASSFNILLAKPNFYMVLHNSESTVNSVQLVCKLNALSTDKIRNVKTEIPKVKTAAEKNFDRVVGEVLQHIVADGEVAYVNVYERFNQIGQPSTMEYIEAAMEQFSEETGINDFIINTKNISIQSNVINILPETIDRLKEKGITFEIKSDLPSIQNKIDMGIDIGHTTYTSEEKLKIMQERLTIGKVGLLIKYKDSRAQDEFGRVGRGEKVSVRIAMFTGFSTDMEDNTTAEFMSFNANYFYTREHWMLEHDKEELKDLVYDDVSIKVDDLGIYNEFIGSRYHFSTAVQYNTNGMTRMYHMETGQDGLDHVVGVDYTIPERIKAVFDDFKIEYDSESLESYIAKTREIMSLFK